MIGDPTELLMFLEAEAARQRLRVKEGGWGWRKGVEIFIAPESRCSFCNQTFETNRIYLIDNLNHRVPKQWRLATGKEVPQGNKIYHPHAFHRDGGVCLNMAEGLAQLLFNSINTGPTYYAWKYYWDVGHACPHYATEKCPHCKKKVPEWVLNQHFGGKYLCSPNCVEDARKTLCAMCFIDRKGHDEDPDNGGPYCKGCALIVKERVEIMARLDAEEEEEEEDAEFIEDPDDE